MTKGVKTVVVLIGVVVAYVAADALMGAIVHHRKVVTVPNLLGKNLQDAETATAALGLKLHKDSEQFDKTAAPGTIIRQVPDREMAVREGRIIRVVLSQGGESFTVPNVVGQPLRNAQTLLQNMGLSMGEIDSKPSLRYAKDVVMAIDPSAESIVSKGTLVNVIVSEGPPGSDTPLIPDFTGRLISEAKRWASQEGLSVSIQEEANLTRGAGEVIQQFPQPDSPYQSGDTLSLVVSMGQIEGRLPGQHVIFDVPAGSADKDVRVMLVDERGESEVYRKAHAPRSRVDVSVQTQGRARARIFINGVMIEEQEL